MKLERKVRLCSAAAAVLIAAIALTGCGGSGKNGSSGDDNKLYVYNWGEYIDESRFFCGCFYRCCHQQQLRRGRDLGTG